VGGKGIVVRMAKKSSELRRPEANAIPLRSGRISNGSGKLLGKITVKPRDQGRMLLGSYPADDAFKGFSIQLKPEPDPEDAVVTQIANAGTQEQYKLLLHIMNYGTKSVTATIWQL
jgi:hypothetical protein